MICNGSYTRFFIASFSLLVDNKMVVYDPKTIQNNKINSFTIVLQLCLHIPYKRLYAGSQG